MIVRVIVYIVIVLVIGFGVFYMLMKKKELKDYEDDIKIDKFNVKTDIINNNFTGKEAEGSEPKTDVGVPIHTKDPLISDPLPLDSSPRSFSGISSDMVSDDTNEVIKSFSSDVDQEIGGGNVSISEPIKSLEEMDPNENVWEFDANQIAPGLEDIEPSVLVKYDNVSVDNIIPDNNMMAKSVQDL